MVNILDIIPSQSGKGATTLLTGWKTGQILKAMVVESTPTGQGGGKAKLALGNLQVNVRSGIPLQKGQTILVQVKNTSNTIQLQLLNKSPPPKNTLLSTLLPKLEELLSNQTPIDHGLAAIIESSKQLPTATARTFANQLQALMKLIPNVKDLSQSHLLRQSIENSGTFFESHILTNPISIQRDLKGQLFMLLNLSRQNGNETITKTIQNLINHISINQAQSVQTVNQQSWIVEIPYLNNNNIQAFQLKIEKDLSPKNTDKTGEERWVAQIQFTLPNLGEIVIGLQSINNQLSMQIWAQDTGTRHLIGHNLPILKGALHEKGIHTGRFQVHKDFNPPSSPSDPNKVSKSLLAGNFFDEKI